MVKHGIDVSSLREPIGASLVPIKRTIFLCALAYSRVTCAQSFLGDYTGHTIDGNTVTIQCGASVVSVQAYTEKIIKVRLQYYGPQLEEPSFMVAATAEAAALLSVQDESQTLTLRTPALEVVCQKFPLRMAFYADGKLLTQERNSGGLGWNGVPLIYLTQTSDEHFYGFGQRASGIDLKGQRFDTYNRPHFSYDSSVATMNINIPFFVSSRGYGIFFDNSYPGTFDMGATDADFYSYSADGGAMIFYLIAGSTMKEVLSRYTDLTGRQPLPPRWALGYLQSKYGYQSEAEAREVVNTLRSHGFPLDAIILDLYWFGDEKTMGALAWDRSRFPNPEQMIADFKAIGVQTILIHEPFIMQGLNNFNEANAQGLLGTDGQGNTITFPFWTGVDAALLDLTNPVAQDWLWSKLQPIVDGGVAGWWTDLGEPDLHPDDMFHYLGSAAKVHNIFNLLWAKTIFEKYRENYPETRLFNLTRSGTAGMQRFATLPWSGDVKRSFSGLAAQLPIMLGMGLSGVAYQHSDIGGFTGGDFSTQPELYARWMQFGTFSPITRAHGVGLPTEPYQFGEQVENICREYIKLRYRLLPYTYSYVYENSQTGLPIARPLVLEYPDDPNATKMSSEYLWGEWLLVAPVLQANHLTKTVYLPSGEWIDFWTKETYIGGSTITIDAALERLPIFVKSGAIIPMQNVMAFTGATPIDTLTLDVYPAAASAFTLYEDDGTTLSYSGGEYAITTFTCEASENLISAIWGKSVGDFNGKPDARLYIMQVQHVLSVPDSVRHGTQALVQYATRAALEAAGEGWWYDTMGKLLVVQDEVATSNDHDLQIFGKSLLTTVAEADNTIEGYFLTQNYPNPFNPTTTIRFRLPHAQKVTLKIFNSIGNEVATLADGLYRAGEHQVQWQSSEIAAGLYFCRLQAGNYEATIKVMLIK